MDAFDMLRADHESVLGMLELLDGPPGDSADSLARRKELATALVMAESQHEAIEEQLFWPAFRRLVHDGDAVADQAIQQEDQGKRLLQSIEDNDAGSADFEEALRAFIIAAREHIAFEEKTAWPALRQEGRIDTDALEALGNSLRMAKSAAPTRPHPNTPSNAAAQATAGMAAAAVDRVRDKVTGREKQKPPQAPPT